MLNELFLRFPDFKLRAVTFSFDDGHFETAEWLRALTNGVLNAPLILICGI